jgi:cobalt-zinc-cadmium efflux system outer membrane protein
MPHLRAAIAVILSLFAACSPVRAAESPTTLSLADAFQRTLAEHPDLRQLPGRRAVIDAEAEIAAQRPAWVVGASIENALGSGENAAFDGAELSLTLASVFEPAAKRGARIEVARSRLAGLDVEAEGRRLDLLAEVARRYLDIVASQAEADAAAAMVAQRRTTVAAAAQRVGAGASPESVRLTAEAALARAELDVQRARETGRISRRRLALLWGEADPAFDRVVGDLQAVPRVPDFAELTALLDRTPELQRFASETRIREARLQLAHAESRPDIDWEVGVRRLQATDDWGLLGSVSMPLGSRERARPGIRAAEAELGLIGLERESGERALYATLAEAQGQMRTNTLVAQRLSDDVLPALERAEKAAGAAYRAGALSYLEVAHLQAELLSARRERIEALRDAHVALIEIQRLTAEPFVPAASAQNETTP